MAAWLDIDVDWVLEAITGDDLPILGVRSDGVPFDLEAGQLRRRRGHAAPRPPAPSHSARAHRARHIRGLVYDPETGRLREVEAPEA